MARAVDRLLAQLPGLQGAPDPSPSFAKRTSQEPVAGSDARPFQRPAGLDAMIGLWARVVLGFALGIMMVHWPYARDCGFSLTGYLAAVGMVIVAGGWAAMAGWRLRAALPHILSLILIFWGLILVAEQVLPRIGYAIDRATWGCEAPTSHPRA